MSYSSRLALLMRDDEGLSGPEDGPSPEITTEGDPPAYEAPSAEMCAEMAREREVAVYVG